jgi:hypothetical protein
MKLIQITGMGRIAGLSFIPANKIAIEAQGPKTRRKVVLLDPPVEVAAAFGPVSERSAVRGAVTMNMIQRQKREIVFSATNAVLPIVLKNACFSPYPRILLILAAFYYVMVNIRIRIFMAIRTHVTSLTQTFCSLWSVWMATGRTHLVAIVS